MSEALSRALIALVVVVACAAAFLAGRVAADDAPAALRGVTVQPVATPTAGPTIVLPPKAVVR